MLTVAAETLTGCLTSHDPAYTAHSMLAAAASLLLHFHAKFFSFYNEILNLILLLMEEIKKTDIVAGGRLSAELHQGIYEKFMCVHQAFASFNVITTRMGIHSILQEKEDDYMRVESAGAKVNEQLKNDL